jgi:hypothetical protein
MQQELPNLVDERRFRRREPEKEVERDEFGRRKWPEERIPIDLEPIPGFNLRAQVVGAGGAYVKYIQGKTKCRVQIKGRGSGFTEHGTGRESDEPMYLHVAGPDPAQVQIAKEDCLDLLGNVKTQYEEFKRHGPSYGRNQGGGGHGDHHGGHRGPPGDRQGSGSYGGGQAGSPAGYGGYAYGGGYYGTGQTSNTQTSSSYGAPGAGSPTVPEAYGGAWAGAAVPGTPATPAGGEDYSAAWAEYYKQGGQDPYAAYGGYEAYAQQYAQWQASQQSAVASAPAYGAAPGSTDAQDNTGGYYGMQGVHAAAPPGTSTSAPPPPPADSAPPPPPGSGYNAVCYICLSNSLHKTRQVHPPLMY